MQIKGVTFQSQVTVGAKTGLDFSVGSFFFFFSKV